MTVFDGVCYSLSPSLSPTRRNELAAVLDLNGAAPHPPYTHIIAPAASHAHNNATNEPAVKLVTDRWVDRSVVMGKRQPEQYYSPDPAMIFSGVVACATDLSAADLEVLSAGITALGGQWRVGLTRDVTHLFALRIGSDKYNTALHFAPQTRMCILTPHWFDDAVRLGRHIPETPYLWPDPPVLRPGVILNLDDDLPAADGRRKRKPAADADTEAGESANAGEQVRVWAGRRILLSTSLELADGSRRAIEARVQRAGGVIVPISKDAGEDAEEKAVDEADVLVTRWRSGKLYFKAARASLLIGTLSWLFSVESSGTLHSPFDSLLWYPTPRGGIPDLIDCEISVTNYTGAARDYLKRLITLVGAKFTPSMSQSNKVLIAGFQPSPKTTRALSWSIPVVNHTWLEDCFVDWRALTVGLERYIMYPPGVDFGKILMTKHDGPPSSQSEPTQRMRGGAVPGGRGLGIIDIDQEETRDTEHRARTRSGAGTLDPSTSHEVFEKATTADGMSMIDGDVVVELRRPRSRAGSVRKTPASSRAKRGSISTPLTVSATGAFVDHVIKLPADDDNLDRRQHTPANGKPRARATSVGSRASMSRLSSVDLFSTTREVEVAERNSGGRGADQNDKARGKGESGAGKKQTRLTEEAERDEDVPQSAHPSKPTSRLAQRRQDVQVAQTNDELEKQAPGETSKPQRRRAGKMLPNFDVDSHLDAGDESEVPAAPRRLTGTGSATPIKSGMKPRPRSKSRSRPSSMLGEESEEEVRVVAPKSTAGTGAGRWDEVAKPARSGAVVAKGKGKEKSSEGKESKKVLPRPRLPTRSPSPTSPKTKDSRTSKRQLSVVVPSVPKEYFSSQDMVETEGEDDHERKIGKGGADTATTGTKRKQIVPTVSIHAVAAEASTSTSKRGRPSLAKTSTPVAVSGKSKVQGQVKTKPKPKAPKAPKETTKARADDEQDMDEEEEGNDTSMVVDVSVAPTSRGGPRRSAANKATARLREEIMPDVVNYEKEQKQAKRRRSAGGESVASAREEGEERGREERGGKRRKLANEAEEEVEEEAEVEDVVSAPVVKAKSLQGKGKSKAKAAPSMASDDDMDDSPAKGKANGSQERKGAHGRGKDSAPVRLMTTGVSLLDDVIKRLAKLGVQMTTKPMDCTHLIAKGIVRTEKFLCAMPVSPYILTEEWANASAKSGRLLPENNYLLSDRAAEQKWSFKFSDAIARSKGPKGGSNLFKQMTFYVTPKVSVDIRLLRNVISAGGGQVQTSTAPTVRILKGKGKRYVITCQEDKGLWRPLVQEGFKVYSPELVLGAALRQEIEWEKEECIVAG